MQTLNIMNVVNANMNSAQLRRLSIYDYSAEGDFDSGYSYTFTDDNIMICLELTYDGYFVALYDLQGQLIRPRVHTDIYTDQHPMVRRHFELNNALKIANELYRHYYLEFYENQQ